MFKINIYFILSLTGIAEEDGQSEAEEVASSVWGGEDRGGFDTESLAGAESCWSLHSMAADFDAWNTANSDASSKGDPKSEMQLR